jgi:tetratricopeptide (TPR) repeat protein
LKLAVPKNLIAQLFGIWRGVFFTGDYATGGLLADRILYLAQREGSPASLAFACRAQVDVNFYRGDLVRAEEHFARGSGFLDATGFRQVFGAAVGAAAVAGHCAAVMGHADSASERLAHARALARDNNNPYDLGAASTLESWLYSLLRDPQRAEIAAALGLAIAEEHNIPIMRNHTRATIGWARAQLGSASEGVALIRQGLAGFAETGSRIGITDFVTRLAEAQALDGKIDDALMTIEEALQANPEELIFRPNALTCRGDLRFKVGQTELAEADFREAIALAQKMLAKAWELRAATSLARLLASQGRRDQARTMLAEIYNWFTEGFDTADLIDAKALLEELSINGGER